MSKITFGGAGGGGGAGVSDHGGLAGLADDDHSQYMLVNGSRAFSATASGTSFGVATQLWISGIPVGDNLGQGGASVDLTAVTTNILPDSSGAHQIGSRSFPFGSGIYNNGFWIRGNDDGQSPGFDRNGWNIRTVAMNGSLTNLESNSLIMNTAGSLLWGSTQGGFTSAADGEVTLKNAAGTASGVFIANSGIFASGVTLRAPNGSGWVLTVDNNGILQTSGPSVF